MSQPTFKPYNENLFQTDELAGDVGVAAVSIRCPHCRELGSFNAMSGRAIVFKKRGTVGPNKTVHDYFASIRFCPNLKCKGLVFVIEETGGNLPPAVASSRHGETTDSYFITVE